MIPPRPTTWWGLGLGCIPALNKPAREPSFLIGEDANSILMVTIPSTLHLPIFELHCSEGDCLTIEEQIQELLEALLDAAKFETCTNDTEPGGAFYGLLRAHYRLREGESWTWISELGIAFSEEVLTPHFDDMASGVVFGSHELKPEECQRIGLPTLLEVLVPEPEVHRPTRFEREDVI